MNATMEKEKILERLTGGHDPADFIIIDEQLFHHQIFLQKLPLQPLYGYDRQIPPALFWRS